MPQSENTNPSEDARLLLLDMFSTAPKNTLGEPIIHVKRIGRDHLGTKIVGPEFDYEPTLQLGLLAGIIVERVDGDPYLWLPRAATPRKFQLSERLQDAGFICEVRDLEEGW